MTNAIQVSTVLVAALLLIAISAQVQEQTKTKAKNQRKVQIARGSLVASGELPHQVAIMDKDSGQFCGGTLVTSQWVISAAHCFESYTASRVQIKAGTLNPTTSTGVTVNVLKIHSHPQYDKTTVNNDIALVELATSINPSSTIQYANLDTSTTIPYGTNMIVSGWGMTESSTSSVDQLRKVTVPVCNPDPNCSNVGTFIKQTMICAGDGSGRDSCPGDSGGPMGIIQNNTFYLSGIVSWGPSECGKPGSYGAYARVVNYLPWIYGYIPQLQNRTAPQPIPASSTPNQPIIFSGAPSITVWSAAVATFLASAVLLFFW